MSERFQEDYHPELSLTYWDLVEAWETDMIEEDGNRTYAVYNTLIALKNIGFPDLKIVRLSTAANFVVRDYINE